MALAATALLAGCIHRLEPASPLALFAGVDTVFPPGTLISVENGYTTPTIERLRTEGIHHLEVDYQRWTERLVRDLRADLERRNAATAGERAAPRLIVWVTAIAPPEPLAGRDVLLEARLQSAQGGYVAWYRISDGLKGFADAYALLGRRILDDERFQEWVLRQEVDS